MEYQIQHWQQIKLKSFAIIAGEPDWWDLVESNEKSKTKIA